MNRDPGRLRGQPRAPHPRSSGPTWRALDHRELLLQGRPDSPVLAGVQRVVASREVERLSLQEPAVRPSVEGLLGRKTAGRRDGPAQGNADDQRGRTLQLTHGFFLATGGGWQ